MCVCVYIKRTNDVPIIAFEILLFVFKNYFIAMGKLLYILIADENVKWEYLHQCWLVIVRMYHIVISKQVTNI